MRMRPSTRSWIHNCWCWISFLIIFSIIIIFGLSPMGIVLILFVGVPLISVDYAIFYILKKMKKRKVGLIICPICNTKLEKNSKNCPKCGKWQ